MVKYLTSHHSLQIPVSPPIRTLDALPWLDDPDIRRARQFALEAHGAQRYGKLPYVAHLDDVVAQLFAVGASKDELIAGYLHDVYEDCPETSQEEMVANFGNLPTAIALSVGSRETTRAAAQAQIVRQLTENPRGGLVKLCDRYCNMRACEEDGKLAKLRTYVDELSIYMPVFEKVEQLRKDHRVTDLVGKVEAFKNVRLVSSAVFR